MPTQPPHDEEPGRDDPAEDAVAQRQRLLRPGTISEALRDRTQRAQAGLLVEDDRFAVLVELNLLHARALPGAKKEFLRLYRRTLRGAGDRTPVEVATNYFRCVLTQDEVERLVRADQEGRDTGERTIYRVWPDFRVEQFIDRSVATVKGDAALRSYQASGLGVTWAVVDSGVNERHPHFGEHANLLYKWGGVGFDGFQAVDASQAPVAPVEQPYQFAAGRFFNLDANAVIKNGGPPSGSHSDIVHPEIAWMLLSAAGITPRAG